MVEESAALHRTGRGLQFQNLYLEDAQLQMIFEPVELDPSYRKFDYAQSTVQV